WSFRHRMCEAVICRARYNSDLGARAPKDYAGRAASVGPTLGNHGMTADVVRWYSAYSGYRDFEMLSVNLVEPTNRSVRSTAPAIVHWRMEPAAITPNAKITHHCACSKKKFGWRE